MAQCFVNRQTHPGTNYFESNPHPGFEVVNEQSLKLTLDDIRRFCSGLVMDEDDNDAVVTHLLETTCKALLLRCHESVKVRSNRYNRQEDNTTRTN